MVDDGASESPPRDDGDPARDNGHENGKAREGAPMDVSGDDEDVPSSLVPTTVVPEVVAAAVARETVKVHPNAPEADRLAIEEHGVTWDDDGVVVTPGFWRRSDGKRICGAHPMSSRGPCKQTAIFDNGRCRMHNGNAARGVAHPQYKHGRWAKAFGKRGDAYTEARDDPELLDLRRTIGALDVIVQESMSRRAGLDTPEFRSKLRELWKAHGSALSSEPDDAPDILAEIGALIKRGASQDDANETIARHVSRMSKHVESWWKINLAGAQSVNRGDLLAVIESIVEVMIQEVPKQYVGPILLAIDRQVLRGQLAFAGIDASSSG